MKITVANRNIIAGYRALQEFDAKDEKGNARYVFKSGKLKLALSKKLRALHSLCANLDEVKAKIVKESGLQENPKDEAAMATANDEWREVLDATEELDLGAIKVDDLDLDHNHLPVWVLTDLDWLLEG